jgi:hypothetical protein
MPTPVALHCPTCGAPLPAAPAGAILRCEYCQHALNLQHTGPMPASAPPPFGPWAPPPAPLAPRAAPTARPLGTKAFAIALVVVVVFVVSVRVFIVVVGPGHLRSFPGGAPSRPAPALFWQDGNDPPVVADINGDGVDDLTGAWRRGRSGEIHFGALDGRTGRPLWQLGPLAWQPGFARVGPRLLTVDNDGLHLRDPATGAELARPLIADRVRNLCAGPSALGQAWLQLANGQELLLDGASGRLTPAPRPRWCAMDRGACWSNGIARSDADCRWGNSVLPVADMRTQVVLAEGANVVGWGVRSPGSEVGMAAGYDTAGTLRWTRLLSDPRADEGRVVTADLARGRFYAIYTVGMSSLRLAVLDANTGVTLWDARLGTMPGFSGQNFLAVGANRVVVAHDAGMDVFDASTGRRFSPMCHTAMFAVEGPCAN